MGTILNAVALLMFAAGVLHVLAAVDGDLHLRRVEALRLVRLVRVGCAAATVDARADAVLVELLGDLIAKVVCTNGYGNALEHGAPSVLVLPLGGPLDGDLRLFAARGRLQGMHSTFVRAGEERG